MVLLGLAVFEHPVAPTYRAKLFRTIKGCASDYLLISIPRLPHHVRKLGSIVSLVHNTSQPDLVFTVLLLRKMGDLITIDQNPGNTLLGSNSALFRFQSVSDLYFGNYFGPINHGLPIHWSNRHVRVHVECMELGTLHVTLQSSPQGGQELRALHANNNRGAILPWAFAGQLVQQFKLTLEDYGMDAKLIDAVSNLQRRSFETIHGIY